MAGDEFSLENGRKINKSQINGEILKSKLSQNDKYQKIFSLFDANNDGKLDDKEVESFFEKMKSYASKGKSSVFESGEAEEFLKEFKDAKGKSLSDNGVKVGDLFGFVADISDVGFDPVKKAQTLVNKGKMNGNIYSSEEIKNIATTELSQDVQDAIKMFQAQKDGQGSVSDLYNLLKEKFGSDEAASKVYAKLCEEKLGASFLYKAKNFELTEKDYWSEKANLAKELYETTGDEIYNSQAQEFENRANAVKGKTVTKQIQTRVQTGFKNDKVADKAVSASATYKTVTKNVTETIYPLMDFDKTFLEERGIKYNEDAVENYDRKKAETQTLVEMNNTLEEVKSQIAKTTAYSDSARVKAPNEPNYELSQGRSTEYMMDSTRVDELESGVYFVYKKLFGSDENINAALKRIGVDSTVSSTGRMSNANQAGKALVKYLENNFKAACGDKTFEQHQKETTEAYKQAYGDKNSTDIANAFIQSQQEGIQNVKTAVSGVGMVVMLAGQFVPGGNVATGMIWGGLATATLGSSAVSLSEATSKKGGMTQEDKSEIIKELSTSVALTATGMGIGKVSSAMYGQLILKNCPMLASKILEIGADATLSAVSTAVITGELDLKGEGLSQLIPILTGLLKSKGSLKTYLMDDFKATSAARANKKTLSEPTNKKTQDSNVQEIKEQELSSVKESSSKKINSDEPQGALKVQEKETPAKTPEEVKQELTEVMKSQGYEEWNIKHLLNSGKADLNIVLDLVKNPKFNKLKLMSVTLEKINKENVEFINKLIETKYYKKLGKHTDYVTSTILSVTNKNTISLINKMVDDGTLTADNNTDIWKIVGTATNNNASMKYISEFYDTEKDFFLSHMGFSVDYQLKELYASHFTNITDKNVDFAIELLHSRRGKLNDSNLDDYINIIKSIDKQGYSFLDANDKHTLLSVIAEMTDTDKALLKKHGFNIDTIFKTLSGVKPNVKISSAQQREFLVTTLSNNNTKANKVFKEFDFAKYGTDGLPLKYSRKDFMNNVEDILNDLPTQDRVEILSHYGIENDNFDGLLNNRPFEDLSGYSPEFKNAAKKVQSEIDKFTTKNEVDIPDKEVKEILDGLIKGLPEFTSIVGKQQHGTHAYSVDIHMLKVLQDAMNNPAYSKLSDKSKTVLKFAAILHDVGKAAGVVDSNHFRTSANYMSSILDKFNLPTEMKHQIIDAVDNHHWFGDFNTDKLSAQDVAAKCRRSGDLDVYKILAKADLANVSSTFHYRITGTSNKAEYDAFIDKKMSEVDVEIKKMNSNAPVVFDSKILNGGKKFPTKKVVKDGVEYNVRVLNLADLPEGMPLEKYGFVSGTTKENATFGVHFSDSLKESYDVIMSDSRRLAQGHPIFSYMLLKWGHAGRISQEGLIFNVDNSNTVIASSVNSVSGFKKNLREHSSPFFNDGSMVANERAKISNLIREHLSENAGVKLSRDEYAELFDKYLKSKKYITQIKEDVKIGDKVIKANDLKSAIEKAQETLFTYNKSNEVDGSFDGNNEMTTVDPVPVGLYSTKFRIEDCSPELLKMAEEEGLPIILNPAKTNAWSVGDDVKPIVSDNPSGSAMSFSKVKSKLTSFFNKSSKISKKDAESFLKQFTLKQVGSGRVVRRFDDDDIAYLVEYVQKYPKEVYSLANELTLNEHGDSVPRFSFFSISILAPVMNKHPKKVSTLLGMTKENENGLVVPKYSAKEIENIILSKTYNKVIK
ncbi:MAG TPA: hypothetical protein DCS44_01695 [Cyanobacteria bacterium UBA10660]|nr:MAG TPA: hypothetical protein CPT83_06250 [Candidatus Gastranaerophilales bacterium HUM_1]HAS93313.1 hypothetical protein [Cyanobacteria bacterium UBA10660]